MNAGKQQLCGVAVPQIMETHAGYIPASEKPDGVSIQPGFPIILPRNSRIIEHKTATATGLQPPLLGGALARSRVSMCGPQVCSKHNTGRKTGGNYAKANSVCVP